METKEGIATLRNILNDLTNVTDSTKSKEYRNVDIGFPIPFLKVILLLINFLGFLILWFCRNMFYMEKKFAYADSPIQMCFLKNNEFRA